MRASSAKPLLAAVVVPLLVCTVAPREADACGGIRQEIEEAKVLLVKAERQLDDGQPVKAALTAARTRSGPTTWSEAWWRSRILATATIRSGGRVSPYVYAFDPVEGSRVGNLRAAVAMLERMRKSPALTNDPTLLAALGEGLAQVPGREADALALLSDLAARDVLPSPSAWAALSRLRAERGLVEEARLARRTCEAMLGDDRKGACTTAMRGDGVR